VEIERVRDFAKGRLELRLEDTRGVSGWLAGQELFLGRVRTVDEVCAIIDGITPADIQRVAREFLRPELAYIAAIGPRVALAAIAPPATGPLAIGIASWAPSAPLWSSTAQRCSARSAARYSRGAVA